MERKFTEGKAAITAALSAAASLLGWRGILAAVWIAAMGLDYLSGSAAACKNGQWNSHDARQGLWHKGGMICVVIAAAIADSVLFVTCDRLNLGLSWSGYVLPLVITWYILTELGSILENAVKLGAPVPGFLKKALALIGDAVDSAGSGMVPGDGEEKER